MVWLAVDKDGEEYIYDYKPNRVKNNWAFADSYTLDRYDPQYVCLPKGTIEKLIGKKMTWEDEPVELQ